MKLLGIPLYVDVSFLVALPLLAWIITKTDLMHLIRPRQPGWDVGYPRHLNTH